MILERSQRPQFGLRRKHVLLKWGAMVRRDEGVKVVAVCGGRVEGGWREEGGAPRRVGGRSDPRAPLCRLNLQQSCPQRALLECGSTTLGWWGRALGGGRLGRSGAGPGS